MAKKITNLSVVQTESQEDKLWASVLSHRNKLLANSDWTQLADSGLTDACVSQWKDWRKQLKSINRANYGSLEAAEVQINNLARRRPFNVFAETSGVEDIEYISLDDYRDAVKEYLDIQFNRQCNVTFLDNSILVEEQYKEAVRYMSLKKKSGERFPLIELTAELTGETAREIALKFKALKESRTAKLVEMRRAYHHFHSLVISATSDVELSALQLEIKQWISTSI